MNTNSISRRHFLKAVGTTAICTAAISPALLAQEVKKKKKLPIGLQLYSVRNECAKDLYGTVNAVGKMGYKGVEFAGYYDRDAKTLRNLLDGSGLKCCGTHIALETLLGDKLDKTVEFNQVLGNKFLIVPSLPDKYRKNKEAWQQAADLFSELAEKVKPHGMRVGY